VQRAHSAFLPRLQDELRNCYFCRGNYEAVAEGKNIEIWIKKKI